MKKPFKPTKRYLGKVRAQTRYQKIGRQLNRAIKARESKIGVFSGMLAGLPFVFHPNWGIKSIGYALIPVGGAIDIFRHYQGAKKTRQIVTQAIQNPIRARGIVSEIKDSGLKLMLEVFTRKDISQKQRELIAKGLFFRGDKNKIGPEEKRGMQLYKHYFMKTVKEKRGQAKDEYTNQNLRFIYRRARADAGINTKVAARVAREELRELIKQAKQTGKLVNGFENLVNAKIQSAANRFALRNTLDNFGIPPGERTKKITELVNKMGSRSAQIRAFAKPDELELKLLLDHQLNDYSIEFRGQVEPYTTGEEFFSYFSKVKNGTMLDTTIAFTNELERNGIVLLKL
ncbi:MAG: hypothetical protein WCW13_04840 [archaeon]|jgi:hypothetical protein